jgi:dTDP-4-amino-4,6-dideoxygalactose transaminase
VNIPAQRIRVDKNAIAALRELLETGDMAYGKYVKEFEHRWAQRCYRQHCVTTNSCTSALEIAIRALNVPLHKEILLPANTYGATLQAVWNSGHGAILQDIEPDLNMSMKIDWSLNIGAVVMVYIGGNVPKRMDELNKQCIEHNVPLIIDAAHAHGVYSATSWGEVVCFSFYATKLITTFGEGGCLVTNREDIAEYARRYRHHGRVSEGMQWDHVQEGANMCMTEAQAVVGLFEMEKLDDYIWRRKAVAKVYADKFQPVFENGNYYKYIVIGKPSKVHESITLPSPVYPRPLHQHGFWKDGGSFPMAEKYCPGHFCLPIYNDMTADEAEYVLDNVGEAQ